jgi:integrase/recombinase XerD
MLKVDQDAREVNTKNSKTFPSYFLPVGDDVRQIVHDWVAELRQLGVPDDSPLFPSTQIAVSNSSHEFEAVGLSGQPWRTAAPIRQLFRKAFTSVGLPYFNPHSVRNTLVELGERLCRTAEEFKAWSQNLGHDQVLTTLTSYGAVQPGRQAELVHGLGKTASELSSLFV